MVYLLKMPRRKFPFPVGGGTPHLVRLAAPQTVIGRKLLLCLNRLIISAFVAPFERYAVERYTHPPKVLPRCHRTFPQNLVSLGTISLLLNMLVQPQLHLLRPRSLHYLHRMESEARILPLLSVLTKMYHLMEIPCSKLHLLHL